jgi:site-specific DNA recombinase
VFEHHRPGSRATINPGGTGDRIGAQVGVVRADLHRRPAGPQPVAAPPTSVLQAALPAGWVIVAHFYDVESGRAPLETRGRGTAHEQFDIPIPRDGGIADLLAEAKRPDRRFDAVICESIDRIARRTYYGTKIEHELERVGVRLFASDEPILVSGKRASAVLTRRVKQGVAEWYVLEILEKSWDGFRTHTQQGWNVGRPPYGYLGDKTPHPVPARRAEGKTKSRLILDPVRAPVVRLIYDLYLGAGTGIRQIRDLLNADPALYPPPVPPDPARARRQWATTTIWEILRNPKYTGYQVWNRRSRKQGNNRLNPPEEWVWSEEPTHPAIVTKDEYDQVQRRADNNSRSRRPDPQPAARSDETTRTRRKRHGYLYRGLLRCAHCDGLRMSGGTKRSGLTYYYCHPTKRHSGTIATNHPRTTYLNHARLHRTMINWLGQALFGSSSTDYWQTTLTAAAATEQATTPPLAQRLAEVDADLADLGRRLDRQVATLETDEATPALRRHVATRIAELETAIADRTKQATSLRSQLHQLPTGPADITAWLARLPDLAAALPRMPDHELRAIYDALQLSVTYDHTNQTIDIDITLTDHWPQPATAAAPGQEPLSLFCFVPRVGFEPTPCGF